MSKKINLLTLANAVEGKNTRVTTRLKTFQKNISFYLEALIEGDIQKINASLGEVQSSVVSLNREFAEENRSFTVYNIFNSDYMNDIIQDWVAFVMEFPMFWIHIQNEEYEAAAKYLQTFHDI